MTEKASQKQGKSIYPYLIVLSLVVVMLIPMTFSLNCVGIILPHAAESLGVQPATLGYYISIMSIINVILLPVYGKIFGKVDVRIIMSVAVCLYALGFTLESFATEAWQFLACGLIVGAGMPPLLFIAPSTLINKWFAVRSGFFLGLVMAFMGLGGVIWNPIGGMLILAIGWRSTLLVFAALCLILTLPFTIFVLRDQPSDKGLLPYGAGQAGDAEKAAAQSSEGIPVSKVNRMPAFYVLLVFAFLLNLGLYPYQMIPSYIAGLPIGAEMPLLGATLASVVMAASTIAKIVWGAAGEKNPVITVTIGLVLGVVGLLGIWAVTGQVVLIVAFVISYGFYYALTNVMLPILTRKFFGMKDYAPIYSKVSMAATIGNMLGVIVWGTLINATGGYTVMFFGAAGSMAVAIVAICAASASIKKAQAQAS